MVEIIDEPLAVVGGEMDENLRRAAPHWGAIEAGDDLASLADPVLVREDALRRGAERVYSVVVDTVSLIDITITPDDPTKTKKYEAHNQAVRARSSSCQRSWMKRMWAGELPSPALRGVRSPRTASPPSPGPVRSAYASNRARAVR